MFRAVADALRTLGGIVAAVVTFPFRLVARLFGGAAGHGRRTRRA
ncbi:LPFR motif small protein [Streptomyces wuyuanensis]